MFSSVPSHRQLRGEAAIPSPVLRSQRSNALRLRCGSMTDLTVSINVPYGTCEGHMASQARHCRQRSRCINSPVDQSGFCVVTICIRLMRPRGESASLPVNVNVGQCGRQRPHFTQRSAVDRSAMVGVLWLMYSVLEIAPVLRGKRGP